MIGLTHFLATTALLKVFAVSDMKIILSSYFFGVLIDLDEIYTFFRYWNKSAHSWNGFKRILIESNIKRRTWIQESGGLLISSLVSIIIKSYIPFLANLLHCIMDWLCEYESTPLAPFYNKIKTRGFIKSRFESTEEKVFVLILLIILLLQFGRG